MGNTHTDLQRGFCAFRPCHEMCDFPPSRSRTRWNIHCGWRNSQFYTTHSSLLGTKAAVRFYSCATPTAAQPPALAKSLFLMLLPRWPWVGSEPHQPPEHSPSARAGSGQGWVAPPLQKPLQPLSSPVWYQSEGFLRAASLAGQGGSFADLVLPSFAWPREGSGLCPKEQSVTSHQPHAIRLIMLIKGLEELKGGSKEL